VVQVVGVFVVVVVAAAAVVDEYDAGPFTASVFATGTVSVTGIDVGVVVATGEVASREVS